MCSRDVSKSSQHSAEWKSRNSVIVDSMWIKRGEEGWGLCPVIIYLQLSPFVLFFNLTLWLTVTFSYVASVFQCCPRFYIFSPSCSFHNLSTTNLPFSTPCASITSFLFSSVYCSRQIIHGLFFTVQKWEEENGGRWRLGSLGTGYHTHLLVWTTFVGLDKLAPMKGNFTSQQYSSKPAVLPVWCLSEPSLLPHPFSTPLAETGPWART